MQSFNTWAFKREQPSEPQLMLDIIAESIARAEPVPFVLYWGKGPRSRIDAPDIECLDYLEALACRVRDVYAPGAALKLIFTDTHARLNGHPQHSIGEYFAGVEVGARQRGFATCWLSDLTRAVEPAMMERADDAPHDMMVRLAACATKWYRGDGTAEEGALQYYRMNMLERRAVELAFPRAIFVTFNGSQYRGLFPDNLPIFYMYSLRRGFSVKPWFLPDGMPRDAAPC